MSDSIVGNVMGLKTTGERVFVLKENAFSERDGVVSYTVRRPSVGQNGLYHYVEIFFADEIETIEANLNRDISELVLKADIQEQKLREAREKAQKAENAAPKNFLN